MLKRVVREEFDVRTRGVCVPSVYYENQASISSVFAFSRLSPSCCRKKPLAARVVVLLLLFLVVLLLCVWSCFGVVLLLFAQVSSSVLLALYLCRLGPNEVRTKRRVTFLYRYCNISTNKCWWGTKIY